MVLKKGPGGAREGEVGSMGEGGRMAEEGGRRQERVGEGY